MTVSQVDAGKTKFPRNGTNRTADPPLMKAKDPLKTGGPRPRTGNITPSTPWRLPWFLVCLWSFASGLGAAPAPAPQDSRQRRDDEPGMSPTASAQEALRWRAAEDNAEKTAAAITYCLRYAEGWLQHADPDTGLLPRRVDRDAYWNAKDCAADNFPFLLLTGAITGQPHLLRAAHAILETERRLTPRVDSLPDTYHFDRQGFDPEPPRIEDLIFGAAEYAKDGLLPVIEWLGPGPWLDRAQEMVADIWKHGAFETPQGTLPTAVLEVNGDLLQVLSRLYWRTGDARYRTWAFRLADHYLLHEPLVKLERIPLRDHGCEILGGLSESYVIAARTDPAKHNAYRAPLHHLLDTILESGVYDDGMMPNGFNPRTGEKMKGTFSDGWGYVYNAFLTVALVDNHAPYRDAVQKALHHVHTHLGTNWENYTGDGYADSVEGAINLLNRIPDPTARPWIEASLGLVQQLQRPDGIAEGWYGDGNSARTMLMHALWLTQGVTARPWRQDVRLGADLGPDGSLRIALSSTGAWNGTLRFDVPRHREHLRLPLDYPRINQFPEWFTVERTAKYRVRENDGPERDRTGAELLAYRAALPSRGTLHLVVTPATPRTPAPDSTPPPPWRKRAFAARTPAEAERWSQETRDALRTVLGLDDPIARWAALPLDARETGTRTIEDLRLTEVEIAVSPARRIRVWVGLPPERSASRAPAVLCVGGHGSQPLDVFRPDSLYRGFAAALARAGAVVISPDIAYHDRDPAWKTLLGQRTWDLMRCVDYARRRPEVDPARVGAAGLSLGGEMTLWLGALDTRVQAVSSCGFLTLMDQMERNHCRCWNEVGLREWVDFPDLYALIAPRALQCQLGDAEPRDQFPPILGRVAFQDVERCYRVWGVPDRVQLAIHARGHEVDTDRLVAFLMGTLSP